MIRSRSLPRPLIPVLALLFAAGCGGGSEAPAPGVSLEGTDWTLTQLAGETVTAPEGGEIPTLRLDHGTHRAAGSSGCNSYTAPYTHGQGTVSFGQAASTRKACPDMFLETAFLGAMENAAKFRIEGYELVIEDDNGHETLRFRAAGGGE
jgi:heat shock protein HslJ